MEERDPPCPARPWLLGSSSREQGPEYGSLHLPSAYSTGLTHSGDAIREGFLEDRMGMRGCAKDKNGVLMLKFGAQGKTLSCRHTEKNNHQKMLGEA